MNTGDVQLTCLRFKSFHVGLMNVLVWEDSLLGEIRVVHGFGTILPLFMYPLGMLERLKGLVGLIWQRVL